MQRKRDGLLPIGEALIGLDGPEEKALQPSPQALHHFTRFDQVNQLVGASEADADMGFMARLMAMCFIAPHQPRRPAPIQARQRPFHALHDRKRR